MYVIKRNLLYLMSINNQWTNDLRRALRFSTCVAAQGVAAYFPGSAVVQI